jgi:pSer/pThr/pTyr-binding forkhead associated (FHA) protein
MAFIEYAGKRYPVPPGDMLVGSGADCLLRLEGPGIRARHAALTAARDQSVTIRRLDETGIVEINGVALGPVAQPLLHGDKITVGAFELLFAEERESGSTMYISAVKLQSLTPPAGARPATAPGSPAKPVGTTGGRLVSLTDGREYVIEGAALRFGREAGADVVVPGNQVSRRHAEIVVTPRGYMLIDTSTNGSFVNGDRVQDQRILARGDVIRIGEEEFRFYADPAPQAAPASVAAAPPALRGVPAEQRAAAAAPASPPPPPPAAAAPASAAHLKSTGYFETPGRAGAPSPAPAASPSASATTPPAPHAAVGGSVLGRFLVRSGVLKGQRLLVKVPIVNIGRAEYCDLVIPDDSVSSQHAKLTRREGVWVLTDLDSTNGTLVDGERIQGEVPLAPGAFVRFGDVQLLFEPTDDDAAINAPKATRMIPSINPQDLKKPSGPSR